MNVRNPPMCPIYSMPSCPLAPTSYSLMAFTYNLVSQHKTVLTSCLFPCRAWTWSHGSSPLKSLPGIWLHLFAVCWRVFSVPQNKGKRRSGRAGCSAERGAVPRPGSEGCVGSTPGLCRRWWLPGPGSHLSSASCLRKLVFALTHSFGRNVLCFTCHQPHLFLQEKKFKINSW